MGALPIANHLPDVHDDAMELEKYASGRAIAQRYRTATGKAATTPGVFDAAAAGDNYAALIIETAGTALGAALGHLVLLLDPMAVVVGGGMIDAPPDYWVRAWRSLTTVLHGRRFQPTSIFKASGGGAVGVLGAACAVFADTGRQPPSVAHPPDPWVVV
jgi:predicted NBD/HSP70 family sugar kinase